MAGERGVIGALW